MVPCPKLLSHADDQTFVRVERRSAVRRAMKAGA